MNNPSHTAVYQLRWLGSSSSRASHLVVRWRLEESAWVDGKGDGQFFDHFDGRATLNTFEHSNIVAIASGHFGQVLLGPTPLLPKPSDIVSNYAP